MPRDPYEVLGVGRGATNDEITKTYRTLAKKYHPDKNPGNKDAEAKFKEVQEAYDILSDKDLRAKYDQFGFAGVHGQGFPGGGDPGAGPGGFSMDDLAKMFGQGGGGFSFEDFIPGMKRGRGRRGGAPVQDSLAQVRIDFLTAANGGKVEIGVDGKTIQVTIPPGTETGKKLRIPKQGANGGNLILEIEVDPHPYFRRVGNDVVIECPISLVEAALGTKVEVPNLQGNRVEVKIPPGITSGNRLRLKGMGILDGNLLVELKIVAPAVKEGRAKELLEELARVQPQSVRTGLGW